MKKLMCALVLVAFAATAYAANDVAPTVGKPATGSRIFEELAWWPMDQNNYIVGTGFDGEYIWISAGDQMTGFCEFYLYDMDGNQIDTDHQGGGATGWGNRDMAWNGDYMFGSYSNMVNGFADIHTYAGFFMGPISPCRALAYDGEFFYTCGFGESLWKLEWNGTWGTSATTTNLGGPWDGAYGLAYDCYQDCLWMSTADYTNNVHQLDRTGFLLNTYTLGAPYTIQGGCTMVDHPTHGTVLGVVQQHTPDGLSLYNVDSMPSPTYEGSWGQIKALFN